jgi:hypothetical protein
VLWIPVCECSACLLHHIHGSLATNIPVYELTRAPGAINGYKDAQQVHRKVHEMGA